MVEQTLIEELIGAIKQDPKMRNRTHSAVVARVDDEGVVWVYVAGSDQETPTATTSAEVKRGDGVMVEWRNDRLYIVGNTTDPSAGKARVQAVEDAASKAGAAASRALTAAASAEESAETAATAAAKAVEDAGKAQSAATAAGTAAAEADRKAVAAGTAADNAQKSANNAQESANNASEYAARALGNLSTVQSVTETLNWITTHGTMTKTDDYAPSTDTEVVDGKKYYSRSGSGTAQDPYVYTLISNPTGDPSASGYYEGVLDPTHVYFVQDDEGDYEVAGVRYAIVTEPKVEDIADYYVLSIDESLNNYVATHLALLNDGLYVMSDNSEWKVKIADDGVFILDPDNRVANSMMANKNIIGYEDDARMEITSESLTAYNKDSVPFFYIDYDGGITRATSMYTVDAQKGLVTELSSDYKKLIAKTQRISHLTNTPIILNDLKFKFYYQTGRIPFTGTPTLENCTLDGIYGDSTTVTLIPNIASIPYDSDLTFTATASLPGDYPFQIVNLKFEIKYTAATQLIVMRLYASAAVSAWRPVAFALIGKLLTTIETNAPAFIFGSRDGSIAGFTSTLGEHLTAENGNQSVIGKYNDNQNDTAFEIGNGTADNARSNAFTVDWDGNVEFALDVTADVGTTDRKLYAAIQALGWGSEVID